MTLHQPLGLWKPTYNQDWQWNWLWYMQTQTLYHHMDQQWYKYNPHINNKSVTQTPEKQ